MEDRSAPKTGSERDTDVAILDINRAVMLWKLEDLTEEQARQPVVASGTNLLGLVKHLAYVERWWFDDFFAGNDVDYPWSEEDPDADFRIEADDTIESVSALYEDAVERSGSIVANADFEDLSVRDADGVHYSLRWIVVHMIEETARHAGHADLARELVDGRTGYLPS